MVACSHCQSERLAYAQLEGDGVCYICFYCDHAAPLSHSADETALLMLGLSVTIPAPIEAALPKTKGCAKGCGSRKSTSKTPESGAQKSGGCSTCKNSKSCGTAAA